MLTIVAITARPLRIPLTRPISSSLGTYTAVDAVIVDLHTEGPSGVGFTMGLGGSWSRAVASYIEDELAPIAIGSSADEPADVWKSMWAPNKARMRGGLGPWGLSAVDIACWDAYGKAENRSLHAMLGGGDPKVAVYGSGGWHDLSDSELITECQSFADRGITAYKYKIGSNRDRVRTRLLRAEMGDEFTLLADANQRYDVKGAIEVSHMLADHGVEWIEEPVVADSIHDLSLVARDAAVPVAAGENVYFRWGFRDLCTLRAAEYLQPDVARCGGVTEFHQIATLAETHSLHLSSHLWHELSISLVGASPAGWAAEYTTLLPEGLWTRPFDVAGGMLTVPDAPGHGLEFDSKLVSHLTS